MFEVGSWFDLGGKVWEKMFLGGLGLRGNYVRCLSVVFVFMEFRGLYRWVEILKSHMEASHKGMEPFSTRGVDFSRRCVKRFSFGNWRRARYW